ncbi:MAG: CBS domain-containing protein [Gemmatimonadaceae bacterium]
MRAREIMTPEPACCTPDDIVKDVAALMRDRDCGCVTIIDQSTARVVGIVTDRDLAIRVVANGLDGETRIGDVMTVAPRCCHDADDVTKAEWVMANTQVRRVPVVDDEGHCVGIISQADLALAALRDRRVTEHELAIVVERISAHNRHAVAGGANMRTLNSH